MTRCSSLLTLAFVVISACVDLPHLPTSAPSDAGQLDASQSASAAPPSLRVGSWNLRKLGLEHDKDVASIASIIDDHFDLVALNEVMWTTDGSALHELEQALGPEWSLHTTSTARPNIPFEHAEHYAVAFRIARIAPCSEQAELRYIADNDGSGRSSEPDRFLREPAVGCYRARDEGAHDFLLAVYHARWGEGSVHEIASEVRNVEHVVDAMRTLVPAERELFLIGDLNLNSLALTGLTTARDRTRGTGSTLGAQGELTRNLYDHLLAWEEAANRALVDDAVVIDVRAEANAPALYRDTISDHLPIVARLYLTADDD